MGHDNDGLQWPVERLEQALSQKLAGRERDWARGVSDALSHLEGALRRHVEEAEASDGLFSAVDLTRPSLSRHVGSLRREHQDFLEQATALRKAAQRAANAFRPAAEQPLTASPLPEPAEARAVANFCNLRQEAQGLIAALRHHREQEIDLVQESVTTDIGAGD